MWSGPRNLSTAMMYSFGARPDFAVTDEPFYAAFLAATGIDHPMRDAILATQEQDPQAVANKCAGPAPDGAPHWYQKHMCHHMLETFPLHWARDAVNVHLIRHPARVIASYTAKRENPTFDDIGFGAQLRLFEALPGPVIDSIDIRDNPERLLRMLCHKIGLPFHRSMLSWPAGGHSSDGVWAAHWYNAVHNSEGFAGPEGPLPNLDHPLLADALEVYRALKAHAIS